MTTNKDQQGKRVTDPSSLDIIYIQAKRLARLEEALQWYATTGMDPVERDQYIDDCGQRAKRALEDE